MEKIKRAYCYLFYKLYKMSEAAPSRWWSEWKASLSIDILMFVFIFSLILYYNLFIDRNFNFENITLAIVLYIACIALPNYFIFNHRDQWKEIVSDFDKLPKKMNQKGGIIVWTFIFLIIANLIFAFYLMSRVDWSQYR